MIDPTTFILLAITASLALYVGWVKWNELNK